jgi:hypothetical protein
MRPVLSARFAAAALLLTLFGGCARPYKAPKTLAAFGVGLLATGATFWVAGERGGRGTVTHVGVALTSAGAVAAFAAGGWMAASSGCRTDPDCPESEVCKEVPAPAGREPYRQCVPR